MARVWKPGLHKAAGYQPEVVLTANGKQVVAMTWQPLGLVGGWWWGQTDGNGLGHIDDQSLLRMVWEVVYSPFMCRGSASVPRLGKGMLLLRRRLVTSLNFWWTSSNAAACASDIAACASNIVSCDALRFTMALYSVVTSAVSDARAM